MKAALVALVVAACATALPLGGVAIDPVTSAKQITKVKAVDNLVPRVYSSDRELATRLVQPEESPRDFDFERPNAFTRAFAATVPPEKPRTRGGRFPRTLEPADASETIPHPQRKSTHALLGGGGGTNRPATQLADFTEL